MNKISTKQKSGNSTNEMNARIDEKKEFPHEPGNDVINNILNYSKALSIRPSKRGGQFEMVLN